MIAQLEAHPGYSVLREWVKAQRERYFVELARHLFAGKAISPEDLAFRRGAFWGMERLLQEPRLEAGKALEAERKRQQEGE